MDGRAAPPVRIRIEPGRFEPAAEVAWLNGLRGLRRRRRLHRPLPQRGRPAGGRSSSSTSPAWPRRRSAASSPTACERWPLIGVHVVHRAGRILAGEEIVVVGTASSHRAAAFQACEFVMDWLKTSAPFWKREILADGTAGEWVEAKAADDEAAERWV